VNDGDSNASLISDSRGMR